MPVDATAALYYKNTHVFGRPSGSVYLASTAVGGVAPGTVLSTTPPFTLWNPTGSNKYLVLIKAVVSYVSGTLGAGSLVFAQHAPQAYAPTGGTELTARSAIIGGVAGWGRAFEGATLTGTPEILCPFCTVGSALATSTAFPVTTETFGEVGLVVTPGTV